MARRAPVVAVALCLLACTSASLPAAPQPLDAVLAYEAAFFNGPRPVCVPGRTEGRAFESEREELRELRGRRPGNEADAGTRADHLRRLDHVGDLAWERPGLPGEGEEASSPLDQASAAELAGAGRRFIETEPGPVVPIALGSLPPPLRPLGRAGCGASLTLTAPAVAGDIAFAEATLVCGDQCLHGTLLALRHEAGGWRLVAIAQTWIT
jgi:hypothetical protein